MNFIESKGKGCLLNNYWKVYHNPQEARAIFAIYDQARREVAASLIIFLCWGNY